ncbi:MAG: oxygenase MpaB family protein, partial [Prosthecobacter sp.]|nr:oxygenase MpaB family protein [Prosthecobacter sp.]
MSLFESHALREIRTLDPVHDHQRIVFLTARVDFPWDTTRALEFALFRTFAVPSISALLQRTGEFEKRAQKRYDDTDIIMSEIMEHGYDSDRGRAAIKRMNAMHGRFQISNDDFLYVLSTFVFVPIRWVERFGWRRMIEAERLAWFHFWREVGRRMNIHDIPAEYEAFERFSDGYEAAHYRFTEGSQRVGTATRELFK